MEQATAYLRRSTEDKQQHSFSRQRASIEMWARLNRVEIVHWFEESISGKFGLDERPQLQAAFASGLPVVVSSVDRLSRDVATGASILKERKVIIADLGVEADSFTINILLCVAMKEREIISSRIREGLQRAKARGVKLGGFTEEERAMAHEANRKRGDRTVEEYRWRIEAAREAGCKTTTAIAEYLNRFGVKTTRGKDISPTFVWRLLRKMEG